MHRWTKSVFFCLAMLGFLRGAGADDLPSGPLQAVPFTAVKLHDQFWAPRLATNREKSLPHNFKWCRQTGRIDNFAKAAGRMPGKFEGIYFNDSDVYKVLEGAAYSLADRPNAAMEKETNEVIATIAGAQQPDGYLNTYFTLAEPGRRWTDFRSKHELYCAGHLIEAAVAHFRATGRRNFLDVAVKLADCLAATFGPDKRHEVPGHEEIELALVKLYRVTGQERYLDLARFFINLRGDKTQRKQLWGENQQDHLPVRQQSQIVGHAVRAMYLYCGVADVAALDSDRGLIEAMHRLWRDVVERKMYVTGGIGARHGGEAFGDAYELPNDSAYCETCAAIGLALWAHRLNLLEADAAYADVLERVLYNGILAGVALDGEHFFYVNPLASDGKHHREPFFGCACCPTNVVRFIPSIPGYIYASGPDGIYVNLYVASTAEVLLDKSRQKIAITQETNYPWDGRVKISLQLPRPERFTLNLRIPSWCSQATFKFTGDEDPIDGPNIRKGYGRMRRTWRNGDAILLDLPMPPLRIEAHPSVKADLGRVAIQRGPLVYCLEATDQDRPLPAIVLARDPKLAAESRPDLLGGLSIIRGLDRDGRSITAVPYYAWDHRQPGAMEVWIPQEGKAKEPAPSDATWQGKLYRPVE